MARLARLARVLQHRWEVLRQRIFYFFNFFKFINFFTFRQDPSGLLARVARLSRLPILAGLSGSLARAERFFATNRGVWPTWPALAVWARPVWRVWPVCMGSLASLATLVRGVLSKVKKLINFQKMGKVKRFFTRRVWPDGQRGPAGS